MSTDNRDYTRETAEDEADNFQMGAATATRSAAQIEEEAKANEYRDIEPGEHHLKVLGFFKKPEPKQRSAYVNGESRTYTVYTVGVKLGKAGDPQAQILDFFDLPPDSEYDREAYLYGSKKTDGKNAGFFAGKLFHFLGRLNPEWAIDAGQALPESARMLGNWKGREIIATIEAGRQEKDQYGNAVVDSNTGLPKVPRNQVKLFSYRPADGREAGGSPGSGGAGANGATRAPQAQRPGQPNRELVGAGSGASQGQGQRAGLKRNI